MNCLHCENEFEPNNKGSGGTNRSFCFTCMPEGLSRVERKKLREQLLKVVWWNYKKSIGCSSCGYSKNGAALEWHHPNGDKEFNPSTVSLSFDRVLNETKKCVLLCANCHREVHYP